MDRIRFDPGLFIGESNPIVRELFLPINAKIRIFGQNNSMLLLVEEVLKNLKLKMSKTSKIFGWLMTLAVAV